MNPEVAQPAESQAKTVAPEAVGDFVAVNHISCQDAFRERFEMLFKSRAHAIDRAPGYRRMFVLKPERDGADYLVVSFWDSKAAFDHWRTSPEFAEGHRRGFADVKAAKERGEAPPMTSRMELYEILTD